MKILSYLVLGIMAVSLVGCRAKTPRLQGPVEQFEPVSHEFEQEEAALMELDVVVNVDVSASMDRIQNDVAGQVVNLIAELASNPMIDYRISILASHDSRGVEAGLKSPFEFGVALPLKSDDGTEIPGARYIGNDRFSNEDVANIFSNSLKIGGFHPKDGYASQYEELFSPVLQFVSASGQTNPLNQGAYRPGAHLMVMFVTDSGDSTFGISGEDFFNRLVSLKGGDASKVMVSGIVIPTAQSTSAGCLRDHSGKVPVKIEAAVRAAQNASGSGAGGRISNICKTRANGALAEDMAQIGKDVKDRLGNPIIKLSGVPEEGNEDFPFTVSLGGYQLIKGTHWIYLPRTRSIKLINITPLVEQYGRVPVVKYTPVSVANKGTGKVKPL